MKMSNNVVFPPQPIIYNSVLTRNNNTFSIPGLWPMFSLIFYSLCAHKISSATYYLNSSEFAMTCMKNVQKTILEGTFIRTPSFLVCARLTNCVRGHTRTA